MFVPLAGAYVPMCQNEFSVFPEIMSSPRCLLVLLVSSFFTNQNNLAGVEFLVRETEFENSLGELISKYSKLTQVITPWSESLYMNGL